MANKKELRYQVAQKLMIQPTMKDMILEVRKSMFYDISPFVEYCLKKYMDDPEKIEYDSTKVLPIPITELKTERISYRLTVEREKEIHEYLSKYNLKHNQNKKFSYIIYQAIIKELVLYNRKIQEIN